MDIEKYKLVTPLTVEAMANLLHRVLLECPEAQKYVSNSGGEIKGALRYTRRVKSSMKFLQDKLGMDRFMISRF